MSESKISFISPKSKGNLPERTTVIFSLDKQEIEISIVNNELRIHGVSGSGTLKVLPRASNSIYLQF